MIALRDKSITDLRVMAQAFGIKDIFEKSPEILAQEIEQNRDKISDAAVVKLPERPTYDYRLMMGHPSDSLDPNDIIDILAPCIALGLKLTLDDERWYMSYSDRTDEGTRRMPLRHVLQCAERVLRGR